jgi:hypothetical protein
VCDVGFVGSGLWEELITRPEKSCGLCVCLSVCDVGTCIMILPVPDGPFPTGKGRRICSIMLFYFLAIHFFSEAAGATH